MGTIFKLILSILLIHFSRAEWCIKITLDKVVGIGTYNKDQVSLDRTLCTDECYYSGFPFTVVWKNTYCFCANDISAGINVTDFSTCATVDGFYVSASLASSLTVIFQMAMATTKFIASGNLVSMSPNIYYYAPPGPPPSFKYSYHDKAGIWEYSLDSNAIQRVFSISGIYQIRSQVLKPNNQAKISEVSTEIMAYQSVTNLNITCQPIAIVYIAVNCTVSISNGSFITGQIMADGLIIETLTLPDIPWERVGAVPNFFNNDFITGQSVSGIYLINGQYQYNGIITSIEFNAFKTGNIDLLLLKPSCGTYYCIATGSCAATPSCSRTLACGNEYCPLSQSCSAICNNRLLNKENSSSLPSVSYIINQVQLYPISNTGYQIVTLSVPWPVQAGYRLGFHFGNGITDLIAVTSLRSGETPNFFYNSQTVTSGTLIPSTSFTPKYISHQFSAVSVQQRNTKFKLMFNTTGIKNVTVNLQSVDNVVASASSSVIVGLNINDTSFANLGYATTNVSYMFIMNPHTGDQLLYYWDFGDNTTLNSTTRFVNHTFTVAGVYNSSVYVYNTLVSKVQNYLIYVKDAVKINFFNSSGVYNPNVFASFILSMKSGTGFNCTLSGDGIANQTQPSNNLLFGWQWATEGSFNVRIDCYNELTRDYKTLVQVIQANITGLTFVNFGGAAFEQMQLRFSWLTGSNITFLLLVNNISYSLTQNETALTGISQNITISAPGVLIGVIRATNLISDIILVANLTFSQKISNMNLIADKYYTTNGSAFNFYVNMSTGSGVRSVIQYGDGQNNTNINYESPSVYWPGISVPYTYSNVGTYNVTVNCTNIVNSQTSSVVVYVLTGLGTYEIVYNNLFFKKNDLIQLSLNRTSGYPASMTNITINWQNGDITSIPFAAFNESAIYNYVYSANGVYNVTLTLQNPLSTVVKSILLSIIDPIINFRCVNVPANTWNGNQIQLQTLVDQGQNVIYTLNPGDGGALITKNINISTLNTQYNFNYTYNTVGNYTSNIWACNQLGCQNCSNYVQIQYKIQSFDFQVQTNGNIEYLKTNLITTISFTGTNFPTALMATFTLSDGSPPSTVYLSLSMMPYNFVKNLSVVGFGNILVKLENLANSVNISATYGSFEKFSNFNVSLTWGPTRALGFGANFNTFPLNNPVYFRPSAQAKGTVVGYTFLYAPIKNLSAIFQCNATLVNGEFSYTFSTMGDFNVSFKVYNPIDQAFIENTLTIGSSIQNTQISTRPLTLMPNYFGYISIQWSVISTESCICVDFANNTKLIYGAMSGCSNCSGYLFANRKPSNNLLEILVRFSTEGDYNIKVFIYNDYESAFANRTIPVTYAQCAPPVVSMTYTQFQNPMTPQKDIRSSQIIVSAVVLDLPCILTKNNMKLWSATLMDPIYLTPIKAVDMSIIPTSNNTQLIIPPRFLNYGLYKLTFSVTMDKNVTIYTFQSSNFTYLFIDKSPIIVGLSSGGISLIVNGIDQNICFTPLQYSQDPDLNVQDFSKWIWTWTCQKTTESENLTNYVYPKPIGYSFTTPKTGCFGDGPGVVNFTSSPCFWGGNLEINGTYQLGLVGMSSDNRTGSAKIIITVVKGIPPDITVQCLRPLMCKINNVGAFAFNEVVFNPSDALLLSATCYGNGTICGQGLWNLILLNETTQIWTPLDSSIANLYIKGVYSMQISLLPSFFSFYNTIKRFQICYNSINLTPNGKSCIQFYIFPLPSGIICTLDKTTVQQTDTVCVNCTFQPNYQYRMYVNVTNECSTLGFNSTGQFCSIIPYQTVNQTYIVRVTNENGGFIDVIAGIIMVTQLQLVDLTKILTNVINGTDQTLTVAIAKGDFKEMSQVYLKYVSVLTASNQITIRNLFQPLTNNSKENLGGTGYMTTSVNSSTMTIESLPKDIRAKYEIDRDQKSTVINSMTAGLYTMVPGDIQSLHLISSVVNAIGESSDCVNRQSQWQLSTKLASLADNFKELQKTAPRDDVLTIATNLLSANYRSDAAANIQIDNGILRDIKFSKDTYLDYDTNLESGGKNYLNVDDPSAAAYSLTLETNSNFQSKIAFGVGSNSLYTIQTISKVLRDITVLNDVPTDLLTSQMQYYSIKTQINDLSNKAFTKGRSTIILPDICAALNSPPGSCSDPNNPIGLEIIATPNNVRAYAQNPNKNGLPIPMNSDFVSLSLFLGRQISEKPVQPNGNNNFTIFISRDPVFAVPDFNFTEPDPQIQPPKSIPGTGTIFTGPQCFEQKLVVYQFKLIGSDQSVHFQIKSNFSTKCTQYLIVGRLGQPPVLGANPDGSVDSVNFTFWGMIPTHTKYCNLIPSSDMPDPFTFFVDNSMFKQSKISTKSSMPDYSKTLDTLYFGVRELTPAEYDLYTRSNRPPVPYTISAQINNTFRVRIFSTGCYFNSNNFQGGWGTAGCVVGPLTTTKVTQCICNHLTSFASGWIVAPNTIDFDYVFSNFDFTKNLTLFVTEIVVALVFIAIFIWARRMDIKDIEKVGVTPLPSNDANDMYLYEVTIDTSIRANAGTSSNVYFILSGEQDETDPRHLVDNKRPILKRGNVDRFLLAVPRSLGILQYIRLWHDNSGKGKNASWYCNYFGVTDLQTKEKFHFLVNSWFAVEENDGQIDRLIAVASVDELLHFEEVFSRKMKLNLSEDHLWLSIMARPPESRFTRVERVA
uniref:PKD1L-1 n=1 Tax=Schmidtea mediterranea TaxID=79327 RepID=A0A0H3YJQ5_SCHMD|nr:PKD1L-1 [Schmidtea mediterranea]